MRARHLLPLLALVVSTACAGGVGGATPGVRASSSPVEAADGPQLHPSVDAYPAAVVVIERSDGTVVDVAVRVADTAERQTHGLMEVTDLPDGTGMLFGYPEDHQRSFWMKNTLVPLDIAFISSSGEILQIRTMQPCAADPCPTYAADATYRDALEVPAGWFEREGIGEGAIVTRR